MMLFKNLIFLFGWMLLGIAATVQLHPSDTPPPYWVTFRSGRTGDLTVYRVRADGYLFSYVSFDPRMLEEAEGLRSMNQEWIARASTRASTHDLYRSPVEADLQHFIEHFGPLTSPTWSPPAPPLPSMTTNFALGFGMTGIGSVLIVKSMLANRFNHRKRTHTL